jgi:hypothetical protein
MDGKPRRQSESVRKYITGMVQALNNFKPPERPGAGEVEGSTIANATLEGQQQDAAQPQEQPRVILF